MAIPFLTSINLRGNETQNHVLHLTGSDPSTYVSAAGGNIYYNTGTDKIKYYDSATWQTIASEAWANAKFVDSVTSGDTNTITIGGTAADPTISANTAAVTNGSLNLATGDQIYDFVIGLGYSTTTGTVTSVAIAGTDGIDVDSGSPITTSGTITLGLSNVPNASLENNDVTFGSTTVALGGISTSIAGLTELDFAVGNRTIGASIGANNLTVGAGTTTVIIPGDLQVTGTVTTNNVETVSTSNGVIFEGNVADANELTLLAGTLTADRTVTLPDADGTVALTSDIPVSGVDFDPVGTDNSTDVTLAGAYDYITISGQVITRNQIDYTTDIANTPTITDTQLTTKTALIDVSSMGSNTIATINHALGSAYLIVQLYDVVTGEVVFADIEYTSDGSTLSNNHVRIEFSSTPTNDIRVVIIDASTGIGSITPTYS